MTGTVGPFETIEQRESISRQPQTNRLNDWLVNCLVRILVFKFSRLNLQVTTYRPQSVHNDPTRCTFFILVLKRIYNLLQYGYFVYFATHHKIVFSFKIIYTSPTCFGGFYAIIRGFVDENQVLLCIGSYVFSLSVLVDSALFSLLPSWLVFNCEHPDDGIGRAETCLGRINNFKAENNFMMSCKIYKISIL